MGLVILILLVLVLLGSGPWYPYSRGWGYQPMGGVGFVLLVVLILVLAGVIPHGW